MRPKEVIQTGHEPRKLRGRNSARARKKKKESVLTGSSCQLGIGCAHENHYQLPDRPDSGGAAAHSASIKGCRPFKRRKKLQHVQLMDTNLHVCLSLPAGRQPVYCSPSVYLFICASVPLVFVLHLFPSPSPLLLFSHLSSPFFGFGWGGGLITPGPETFDQPEPRCFYRATVFFAV